MKRSPKPVELVTAERFNGPPLTIALSRSRKSTGYVLEVEPDGRYRCPCFKWRRVFDCPHIAQAGERARERRAA